MSVLSPNTHHPLPGRATREVLAAGLVAASLLASAACGGSASLVSPTQASNASTPFSAEALAAMTSGIQDEYRAEAIYQGVVNDFGPVVPFAAIIGAEVRHSSSIGQLFTTRGLPVPVSAASVSTVPHFGSIPEACAAGALAERENIALYDQLLTRVLPNDVQQVFSNNRRASLDNHLPAFLVCS